MVRGLRLASLDDQKDDVDGDEWMGGVRLQEERRRVGWVGRGGKILQKMGNWKGERGKDGLKSGIREGKSPKS
jgi:hypothetical protein